MIDRLPGAVIFFQLILFFSSCEKPEGVYLDDIKTIKISNKIKIDMKVIIKDPVFNYSTYNDFLEYLTNSDRFLIVNQKDFEKTFSQDKVIISLRHDVDYNIKAAIKFAYFENKHEIRSTYFVLHTADYYGKTKENYFIRDPELINYLKMLQDNLYHEIGIHNDLVTLQVVYNLSSREFLHNELEWMRGNDIKIWGTSSHGSIYCYQYHYVNAYFWDDFPDQGGIFSNYNTVTRSGRVITIEKDSISSYDLSYYTESFSCDCFFSDSDIIHGRRWNMGMVDFDTIQPGKKVIILLHPEHWE